MARPRKTQTPDAADLAHLKTDPEFVLEGGKTTLPVWVRDGNALYQPCIILWLDSGRHTIRGTNLVNPLTTRDDSCSEAVGNLIQSCTGPFAQPEFPFSFELPARGQGLDPLDLSSLLAGMPASPQPALPARIRVNDAKLASIVRSIFAPLGVAVEHVDALPTFDDAVAELTASMGGPQDEPPQPFEWELGGDALGPLFAGAAAYWRRKPWEYLDDYPPVVVYLGENGPQPAVPTLYASILGAAGEVFGVAFYYSADALDRLVQRGEELLPEPAIEDAIFDQLAQVLQATGAPIGGLSRTELRSLAGELMGAIGMPEPSNEQMRELIEDSIAVFFSPTDETDPTYLDWLAARNLKYPSKQGVPSFIVLTKEQEHGRQPNAREVRALTLALHALADFFKLHAHAFEAGTMPVPEQPTVESMHEIALGDERMQVRISHTFSADEAVGIAGEYDVGYDVEEPPPASDGAASTLYRFHVALEWKPDVWRRIELRGDQTLEDLHDAIQKAFGWDDDHLYSFYLNRKAFDPTEEYCSPYADCKRHVSSYRLERVPLKPRKKLLYLFDYGDELRHVVTVEAIVPGGVEKRKKYPRVAERQGRNVPQYASW